MSIMNSFTLLMKSILSFTTCFLFSVAGFAETNFRVDETQQFLEKSFPKKLELLNQSYIQSADLIELLNTLKLYLSLSTHTDRVPAQLTLGIFARQVQDLLRAQGGQSIQSSNRLQNTTTPQGNLFTVLILVCLKKLRPSEMWTLKQGLRADTLAIIKSTRLPCIHYLAPSMVDPNQLEILKGFSQFFEIHLEQHKVLRLIKRFL